MDLKSIAADIAAIAPSLGAAIGGPVGSIAGMGIKTLASAFGIESSDAAEVSKAIANMTPEQALALKQADKDFELKLKELDVDVFSLEVQDRAAARTAHADAVTPTVVTYLMITIAGFLVAMIMITDMAGVDKTLVGAVIGYVFSELKQITGYWFGTSRSSKEKTDALSAAVAKR